MEYGSVVWLPYTVRNIDKPERIQRRGRKFFLGKRNFIYEECLKCLNLLSLVKRRCLFDVTFLYKALNGYLNVDVFPFLNFYSQDDPYRFRQVEEYSLKTNSASNSNACFHCALFDRKVTRLSSSCMSSAVFCLIQLTRFIRGTVFGFLLNLYTITQFFHPKH